ncbi:MAG: metallophosphoesterase [Gammaproteobacteria bacterium]
MKYRTWPAVRKPLLSAFLLLLTAGLLTGCGGGSGGDGVQLAEADDTGTALITLTDAEGDFAAYAVDITSITLERADGTIVETLPNRARIDFTQYVDLTEMFTAAQVPAGVYVGGAITIDYTTSDVQVEVDGAAVPAIVQDTDGNLLGEYTLRVRLEDQDRLVVRRGLPALLEIDFDLDASHRVDTTQATPVVTTAPFLIADIGPVDEKDLRIRGPLVSVDFDAMSYDVKLRPWHRRDGDFGPFTVDVTDETEFEVDGTQYSGSEGLRALNALGAGTPTVAKGTLNVEAREFTAATVLAGDSVPGHDYDAVIGNVVARENDTLTVRGATIVPTSGSVVFNDNVAVTIGRNTIVTKAGHPRDDIDTNDISVGQRVRILGTITSDPALPGLTMDATEGRVRLKITHLSGMANSITTGLLSMNLRGIDRRPVDLFDFSGTGMTPDQDADPKNYEVDTSTLGLGFVEPETPLIVYGFVNEFGAAPPDFTGRTVVDIATARAKLGIGWLPNGTTAPFLTIGPDGIVPDLENPDLGKRHHIKIGNVVIDLTELPAAPTIVGLGNSDKRTRYAILERDRVQLFRSYDRFVETLGDKLDGSTVAYSMHAAGRYVRSTNTVHAHTVGVRLGSPAVSPAAE